MSFFFKKSRLNNFFDMLLFFKNTSVISNSVLLNFFTSRCLPFNSFFVLSNSSNFFFTKLFDVRFFYQFFISVSNLLSFFFLFVELQGLGFKVYAFNNFFLKLELGFSHGFILKSRKKIIFFTKSNKLVLFSLDLKFMRNLVYLFSNLKNNSYKVKGFFFEGKQVKLKVQNKNK